ncbi:hypothetical protein [Streptomyces sp. BA2]|uniref:hypothetical protein n=1 Tax=Streptomyces sp. BA2 TaxID=436595 RepID=UPI0013291786|nr:hypothetical protein [Streptomyces sp. BA2]MWA11419.1 hypothetical protein [Streptomyces sp. BA2]
MTATPWPPRAPPIPPTHTPPPPSGRRPDRPGASPRAPSQPHPVPHRTNPQIKRKSIHAAFTTDPEEGEPGEPGEPLEGLNVIISLTPDPTPDKPWERYDTDLNAGVGGKFIYLTRLQYRG